MSEREDYDQEDCDQEDDEEVLRRFQEKYDEARDALERGGLDAAAGRGDPPPMRRMAQHLSDMQGALRRISSGAVSRDSLTESLRRSIETMLERANVDVVTRLGRIADEVETRTAASASAVRELRDELRVALGTFRSDMGPIRGKLGATSRAGIESLRQELSRLSKEVQELPANLEMRREFQEIKARLAGLHKQLDRQRTEARSPDRTPGNDLTLRLEAMEERLDRIEIALGTRPESSTGVADAGIDRLEASVSRLLLLEILDRLRPRDSE